MFTNLAFKTFLQLSNLPFSLINEIITFYYGFYSSKLPEKYFNLPKKSKICVIGLTCAGKSTFIKNLRHLLPFFKNQYHYISIDNLRFTKNWQNLTAGPLGRKINPELDRGRIFTYSHK